MGQEAFTITAQFPWQSQPLTKAMIEITRDETVLLEPIAKSLIHGYGEPIELKMLVYSIEEIILEKLRAILQHTKKLHERDWSRSRARDYYDLWRIFGMFGQNINWLKINDLLIKKCLSKGVEYTTSEDFFDKKMMQYVSKTWGKWLGPLMSEVPSCGIVINELKDKLEPFLTNSGSLVSSSKNK